MVGTWDREDVRNIAICRRGRASLDRYVRVLNEDKMMGGSSLWGHSISHSRSFESWIDFFDIRLPGTSY